MPNVKVISRRGPDSLGNETVVVAVFPPYREEDAKRGLSIPTWRLKHTNICFYVQYHFITRFWDKSQGRWRYIDKGFGTFEHDDEGAVTAMMRMVEVCAKEIQRLRAEEPLTREPFRIDGPTKGKP